MNEHHSPYDFRNSPLAGLLRKRWIIFLPGSACIAYGAIVLCVLASLNTAPTIDSLTEFFLTIVSGPFASIWMDPSSTGVAVAVGIACISAGLAHPVYPNIGTAIVSTLAFGVWLFIGMALACIGV